MASRAVKLDGYGSSADYGFDSIKFWMVEACSAGDFVGLKANDTTNPAGAEGFTAQLGDSDASSDYDIIGIAMEAVSSAEASAGGKLIQVQTRGRYSTANVATGASKGNNIVISSTGGRAEAVGVETADTRILGRCLADSASNVGDVILYPHPWLA